MASIEEQLKQMQQLLLRCQEEHAEHREEQKKNREEQHRRIVQLEEQLAKIQEEGKKVLKAEGQLVLCADATRCSDLPHSVMSAIVKDWGGTLHRRSAAPNARQEGPSAGGPLRSSPQSARVAPYERPHGAAAAQGGSSAAAGASRPAPVCIDPNDELKLWQDTCAWIQQAPLFSGLTIEKRAEQLGETTEQVRQYLRGLKTVVHSATSLLRTRIKKLHPHLSYSNDLPSYDWTLWMDTRNHLMSGQFKHLTAEQLGVEVEQLKQYKLKYTPGIQEFTTSLRRGMAQIANSQKVANSQKASKIL